MKRIISVTAGFALAIVTTAAVGQSSSAQNYPQEPIRIVVPYSPGGGTDTFARRLADKLGPELGQQIVIENIAGASGSLGMQEVAEAEPDGYTLIFALSAQFAVNPSLFAELPYDPVEDFAPISLLGAAPYVLVVHPSLDVNSVEELIALAKEKPGELVYASSGIGSGAHLATELLKTMAGVDLLHSPYKGSSAAYPDLLSGRAPVMFATFAPIEGYIADERLVPLAVSSGERSGALPDLPSVAETLPGYDAGTWYALAAPAGTPEDIIAKLNEAVVSALNDPELRQQLESDAIQVIGSSPEELAQYIPEQIEKWGEVVEASGATAQ